MSHSITPPLIKSVFTTDTYMCAFELQCYLSQCHSIQIPFVNSVCVHATVFHVTCCLSLHPPHHLSHSEPRTRTLCTLLLRVHFRLLPTKQSSPFPCLNVTILYSILDLSAIVPIDIRMCIVHHHACNVDQYYCLVWNSDRASCLLLQNVDVLTVKRR
eukprot:683083_1